MAFHPMQDEIEAEDKLTDFNWLASYPGPEIVVDPMQLEELVAQTAWEETEDRLDNWPVPDVKPNQSVVVVGSILEDADPMKGFWNVWNEFQNIFRGDLRTANSYTVDHVIDRMQQFDWWAINSRLFSNPPSMINELRSEILKAQDRPVIESRAPSAFISAGRFQRVVIDGITHIQLVKEEVHV